MKQSKRDQKATITVKNWKKSIKAIKFILYPSVHLAPQYNST